MFGFLNGYFANDLSGTILLKNTGDYGILNQYAIYNSGKLIIQAAGTDAVFNMENAFLALLQAMKNGISEVMIVFGHMVLRGSRTIKMSESHFHAFESPAYRPLAEITALGIGFRSSALKVDTSIRFDFLPHFQRNILTIDLVPGQEPGIVSQVLRSGTCRGLILKSHGAGNVPIHEEYSFIPVIEKATELRIPVLISTKFVGGKTLPIYEPAIKAMAAGAIPTGDMTDVMAQVKFMWALAQGCTEREALSDFLHRNFVGEITPDRMVVH